jgi:L-iditol 2-dehydrogenase
MRALQLQRTGQLTEVELPVPVPAPDEVLIRTAATTICTSDLNDIFHNPFGIVLPRVLGHEGAGTVAAVGEQVRNLTCGERVAAHPVIPCRQCANCARGLGHLCERMGHLGLDREGTFAEYFCIPADRIRRVPKELDFAVAALLEPIAVCIEALERAQIGPQETLLIAGDGPFGLIIARLAHSYAPKRIILVGRHNFRLQQVRGAVAINETEVSNAMEAIRVASEGAGVDAAILAVGNQSALDLCVNSLRARGRVVVFSAIHNPASIDMFRLHLKELSLVGACNDEDHMDNALRQLSDPQLGLEHLITHRLPFEEWTRGFELARHGKDCALKVALVFGSGA